MIVKNLRQYTHIHNAQNKSAQVNSEVQPSSLLFANFLVNP